MFPYGIWMGGRQGRQQMELRQLECFAAVVEEGSISAAARKLHMSQPPLSLRMHQLEAECGVTLFVRGARQITLTEAGNLLFRYAREILELETAAGADLESLRRGRRGNIRLGLISSCGCRELYDGIRRFHISHPDISFVIREGNTFDLQEDIRENRIELAVIRTPYRDASLEHITLRTDPMAAAGALPGTDDEGPLPLRALTGFPLILYRRWESLQREALEAAGITPDVVCTCDDARTALQWASEGLGTALVPSSILALFPDLSARELDAPELVSSIHLVRKKDAVLSESADLFYRSFRTGQYKS